MKPHAVLVISLSVLAFHVGSRAQRAAPPDMPAELAYASAALAEVQIQARAAAKDLPLATLQCLLDLKADDFVPLVREQFEAGLTPAEIASAESFYGGPLRERLLSFMTSVPYRTHALALPPGSTLAPAEDAELGRFIATPAGHKLMEERVLDRPDMARIRRAHTGPMFARCKALGGK